MDFYLPEWSLAIYVNPNKTHNSNLFAVESDRVMFDSIKEKTYHYNKYKLCADKGITLIQLYSFDLEPVAFHTKTAALKNIDKYGHISLLSYFSHVRLQMYSHIP